MNRRWVRVMAGIFLGTQMVLAGSGCGNSKAPALTPTVYPTDSVKTIADWGMSEGEYIRKNRGPASYSGNSGHREPTLVISPYYTLTVNGTDVPVYATVVYDGVVGEAVLHSYAIVEVPEDQHTKLSVELTPCKTDEYEIHHAMVLPDSLGIKPLLTEGKICADVQGYGSFCFLMNDEDSMASQRNAFSLFVRPYRDEEKEIAAYRKQYGEDHVIVYEAGTHYFDYIDVAHNDSVLYLRRGAYLIANGREDYSESNQYEEAGASSANAIGFSRYPVVNVHQKTNVTITGGGTIDAGQLGWHERRGMLLSRCSDCEVSGLTFLNFPEWTLFTYCCSDITYKDCRIFGYKTNSDGFAMCNTVNGTVSDCFARSGDDLFEVKTLGGAGDDISKDITFTNCVAWASKARCFGVIGETSKDVSHVIFRDCAVVQRDATWNNDILGSLVVIMGDDSGMVSDVTFENIEVYNDCGRAINISIEEGQTHGKISDVVFRNITFSSVLPGRLHTGDAGSNSISGVVFDHVIGNGKLLTAANIDSAFEWDANCGFEFAKEE